VKPQLLLANNIPRPMHGLAPRVVMGRSWWDKTRKEAYKKTDYHCQACGVHKSKALFHKWLEGHETYDIDYQVGRMVYLETVALCHACHNFIHDGRLHFLMSSGRFPHDKFRKILDHGTTLLRMHGLQRPTYKERDQTIQRLVALRQVAPWDQWRMVFQETLYPPLKSESELASDSFEDE